LRIDFRASIFELGSSRRQAANGRLRQIKTIKRWRESLFHSFLVNATNTQSVRGLRQVVLSLLHPIRRVCLHRKNSTPQLRDVVHPPIVAPIVAQGL
jgi:hypothetical protein